MKRSRFILILPIAAIPACTVGPNFKPPEQPMPAAWAGLDDAASGPTVISRPSDTTSDLSAWWMQFQDPMLTGLIERAATDNLTVAQAEARIRQARATRQIAASGLYPDLNASAGMTRARTGGGNFSTTGNLFRAGFDATWELDVFGGIKRGVEAADAGVQSAILDRESVLVSLAGEVATTYLDLRGAQRQLAIARQNVAAQQQTLDLTQERFDAGFVSALDVANAKAQTTATAATIPLFDAQMRSAIYALGVLVGREPGELLEQLSPEGPVPVAPAQVPIGLPSELLLRRPDLQKAEADLHAATARVGVAVADQYPKFSLTGSFGTQGNQVQSLGTIADRFWSFGPAVTVPLFTGGRIQGTIEQTQAVADEALLTYRQSVLIALQDVETSLVNFTREQERRASLAESTAANRQAVDLSLQLYSAGKTTFLDVLSAQRQLFLTESQEVQSNVAIGTDLVALYKALGGGWKPEEVAAPDQPASAGSAGR